MQIMRNIVLYIIIIISFISCDNNEKLMAEKKQQEKKKKELFISSLVEKYDIAACFDTLKISHSIEFQEKYNSKFLLLDKILIVDIYMKDSICHAILISNVYPTFSVDYIVSNDNLKKLRNLGKFMDAVVVVTVNDVISTKELPWDIDYIFKGTGEILEVFVVN